MVLSEPQASPLELQITKYNRYLTDLTILRDKVRDQIVTMDKLRPRQIQIFNEDRTPKMDKNKGTPIIEEVLSDNIYTGKPMTQPEADQFRENVSTQADEYIKQIKALKQ